jgi:sugar O-acyltransferase (sialic acid O-acetyltransferase NeuD family)
MKVLIIGAGGHGQVVADIFLTRLSRFKSANGGGFHAHETVVWADWHNPNGLAQSASALLQNLDLWRLKNNEAQVKPAGFLDDNSALQQQAFLGLPVLGATTQLPMIAHDAVIVAIGDNHTRQEISDTLLDQNEQFVTAIHPTTVIGAEVKIGVGTMICARVVINPGAHLGRGVILNTGCTVDHHNRLGDYVHIGPGVHLGGDVEIEEGALVGIGATVMPQRRIGAWSVVGAGAVVTRDIPAYTTVVGVPARVIGEKSHLRKEDEKPQKFGDY